MHEIDSRYPKVAHESYCSQNSDHLTIIRTIEQGVEIVRRIVRKPIICKHDVDQINQIYRSIDHLERNPKSRLILKSVDILNEIIEKVSEIAQQQNLSARDIIFVYYLRDFSEIDLRIREVYEKLRGRFINDSAQPFHDIASALPFCFSKGHFQNDIEAMIGPGESYGISKILREKEEQFEKIQSQRKKINQRAAELETLRKENPKRYPPYLDQLLTGCYFHLFDHFIQMKNPNKKSQVIKEMTFPNLSHIILETQQVLVQHVRNLLPIQSSKPVVFLLGPSGVGKSTTLCFLRRDSMTLNDPVYESSNDKSGCIGSYGSSESCTFFPNIEILDDVIIVDFAGFKDTHGQIISLGEELALKVLIKEFFPKILVLARLPSSIEEYEALEILGDRLDRLIENKTDCILGITQYSLDVDYRALKLIEGQEKEQLLVPTHEEIKLQAGIEKLSEMMKFLPEDCRQSIEKEKQKDEEKLEKLIYERKEKSQSSQVNLEKLEFEKRVTEKEIQVSKKIGITHLIKFADLTSSFSSCPNAETFQKRTVLYSLQNCSGMVNSMNDCFFNSVFQLIIHSSLKKYLLENNNLLKEDGIINKGGQEFFLFIEELCLDYEKSTQSQKRCEYVSAKMRKLLNYEVSPPQQQDCAETLTRIIKFYDTNALDSTFYRKRTINIENVISVPGILNEYSEVDKFDKREEQFMLNLVLPEFGPAPFQQLVNNLFLENLSYEPIKFKSGDTIYQSNCSLEQLTTNTLNELIFFNILRFDKKFNKNSTPLLIENLECTISETVYVMQGFIVHYGTTINSGHYKAFCQIGKEWVCFDDERCEEISLKKVLDEVKDAYILHFRKQEAIEIESIDDISEKVLEEATLVEKQAEEQSLVKEDSVSKSIRTLCEVGKSVRINPKLLLDYEDKKLLDLVFKKDFIYEIMNTNAFYGTLQDFYRLKQNLKEYSLTYTLAPSPVGQFLHLEEIPPSLVREYDGSIANTFFNRYIDEVIKELNLSLVMQLIKNVPRNSKVQQLEIQLRNFQKDVLSMHGMLISDLQKLDEAWVELETVLQKKSASTYKDSCSEENLDRIFSVSDASIDDQYELSVWTKALVIPSIINFLLKSYARGQARQRLTDQMVEQSAQEMSLIQQTIFELKDIEMLIKHKPDFDAIFLMNMELFTYNHLNYAHLHHSIFSSILKLRRVYGNREWDLRVSYLAGRLDSSLAELNPSLRELIAAIFIVPQIKIVCIYQKNGSPLSNEQILSYSDIKTSTFTINTYDGNEHIIFICSSLKELIKTNKELSDISSKINYDLFTKSDFRFNFSLICENKILSMKTHVDLFRLWNLISNQTQALGMDMESFLSRVLFGAALIKIGDFSTSKPS